MPWKCSRALDHLDRDAFKRLTELGNSWQLFATVKGPLRCAEYGAATESFKPLAAQSDGAPEALLDGFA